MYARSCIAAIVTSIASCQSLISDNCSSLSLDPTMLSSMSRKGMLQHADTFLEILNQPALFGNQKDKIACEELFKELTAIEVEEIAQTSYAYWTVSTSQQVPPDARRNSVLKEIRRHYVGEGRDRVKCLAALKESLKYRKEYNINRLRSCFYRDEYESADDARLASRYKTLVTEDLERQTMVVRGCDCHFRTIVYKPPRTSNPKDSDEAFLLTQFYTAERAIATSEFNTNGREEKLAVIFNFRNYNSANSPSSTAVITLTKVLQRCYPERLGVLLIVEPPFWMRALYSIVRPFMSQATTEKFKMASGNVAIETTFHELAGNDDNLFQMLQNSDMASVDVNEYTQIPFYRRYDDVVKR